MSLCLILNHRDTETQSCVIFSADDTPRISFFFNRGFIPLNLRRSETDSTSHLARQWKVVELNLPEGYAISVAAQGLKRVRFMAQSPDNRIFVTDMYNLTDNSRGVVYVLDQFDPKTYQFKKVTRYLSGLRNPNSVAFYTDRNGTNWFYLALTERLLRYRYEAGKDANAVIASYEFLNPAPWTTSSRAFSSFRRSTAARRTFLITVRTHSS